MKHKDNIIKGNEIKKKKKKRGKLIKKKPVRDAGRDYVQRMGTGCRGNNSVSVTNENMARLWRRRRRKRKLSHSEHP